MSSKIIEDKNFDFYSQKHNHGAIYTMGMRQLLPHEKVKAGDRVWWNKKQSQGAETGSIAKLLIGYGDFFILKEGYAFDNNMLSDVLAAYHPTAGSFMEIAFKLSQDNISAHGFTRIKFSNPETTPNQIIRRTYSIWRHKKTIIKRSWQTEPLPLP